MTNDWSVGDGGKWQLIVRLPSGGVIKTLWECEDEPTPQQKTWAAEQIWQAVADHMDPPSG